MACRRPQASSGPFRRWSGPNSSPAPRRALYPTYNALSEGDLHDAESVIEPGSSAAVLIFENAWAAQFVQAMRGSGAELVAAGYIPQDDIVAALDASDN